MGYIAKDSLLKAYFRLSQLSDNPIAQGATQRVSALRYFVALDQFYFEQGRNCDTKINSDKELFSKHNRDITTKKRYSNKLTRDFIDSNK